MAIPQSTPTYSIPPSPASSSHSSSRFQSNSNQPPAAATSSSGALSSGFSSLLKSARKSTDSLRSARSFGRARSKKVSALRERQRSKNCKDRRKKHREESGRGDPHASKSTYDKLFFDSLSWKRF